MKHTWLCLSLTTLGEHQAIAEGVCSYPSLSGCSGETEEDTQALCTANEMP
jgi:hypothetical protein